MKFALLGIDPDAWPLVRAICADASHELVTVCSVDRDARQRLQNLAPQATWHAEWEVLLSDGLADAVVVARPRITGEHDDPLRKLAQKAVPLMIVHPAAEPLLCYELEMIQRDTNGVLFPYVPGRLHPAILKLQQWTRDAGQSPIGTVQQVDIERAINEPLRAAVLCQFAKDVELIAAVAGKVDRVSAIGPAVDDDNFANLSVQMSCAAGRVARWLTGMSIDEQDSTLNVIGSQGRATLRMSPMSAWRLQAIGGTEEPFAGYDDASVALAAFCRAVVGQPYHPDWPQACRSVEVADAVPRSLRRGRTIDILDEPHSEEQSFKGIMAAGGCAILLGVLIVILVLALVDGLTLPHQKKEPRPVTAGESNRLPFEADPRDPDRAHILLRIWPVYPIAIFLLLQFLRLIIKQDPNGKTTGDSTPSAGAS